MGDMAEMAGMGAAMYSNPYTAIAATVIKAMSQPKIDISKAGASGQAGSGFGVFENDDVISTGGRVVDFSDPKSVLIAGAVLVGAIYVIKKIKRF